MSHHYIVKRERPNLTYEIQGKNFITEEGFRYQSFTRSFNSEEQAMKMAKDILPACQIVFLKVWSGQGTILDQFRILQKNGFWKEVNSSRLTNRNR